VTIAKISSNARNETQVWSLQHQTTDGNPGMLTHINFQGNYL